MRALVTGVAGFVGSHLARRLLDDGDDVLGVDCFSDYYDRATKAANLEASGLAPERFREVDLLDADLPGLLAEVDVVFHQAGQPGVRASWGSEFDIYLRQNVAATQRLLEAAATLRPGPRIVYASSSSVYGDAEAYPTTEDTIPRPVSPYGVTKLAAEHLCTLYARNFGVDTRSLRYFTVYGPRQRPDMAFTRFVRAAVADDMVHVFGDGEQVRDFTFVDDIVAANLAAARGDVAPGSVFNVAGGAHASVNEVLAILGELRGVPMRVEYSEAVKGDVRRTSGSTEKIAAALDWAAQTGLHEGLARHLAWAR